MCLIHISINFLIVVTELCGASRWFEVVEAHFEVAILSSFNLFVGCDQVSECFEEFVVA